MLTKSAILKHYKRRDIQDALIEHAQDKEIGMCYGQGYGKRPDILSYPHDVLELALRGVSSFHSSEELWLNPLSIGSDLSRKELAELRFGWDLVLDIDCAILEYSKICADLIVKFLKYCGVQDFSIKFSGNKGFHIGVPFEAFPGQVGEMEIRDMFPEAARKIAFYIKENIKTELARRILEHENDSFSAVKEKVGLSQEEIIRYEINEYNDQIPKLNVDNFLEIDTVLISTRHLYRMPYSLHEKSGLVSLPIDPDKVMEFEKPMADPERILTPSIKFMNRNVSGESARNILQQALDFEFKPNQEELVKVEKTYEELEIASPIKEDFFPPCMHNILKGMGDGKKRAIFILSNFLGKIGWDKKEIEAYLHLWNKKNSEPLREVYIKGQMYSFTAGAKLPPNCANDSYAINICAPDNFCRRIKNPANYTLLKWKSWLKDNEEEKP